MTEGELRERVKTAFKERVSWHGLYKNEVYGYMANSTAENWKLLAEVNTKTGDRRKSAKWLWEVYAEVYRGGKR